MNIAMSTILDAVATDVLLSKGGKRKSSTGKVNRQVCCKVQANGVIPEGSMKSIRLFCEA
jgi:hypothetical protein